MCYNAPLNLVHGGRGRGKTHYFKRFALTRKEPTMWLIRSDKDLLKTGRGFLEDLGEDIQNEYHLSWVVEQEDKPRAKKKISYPAIIDFNNEIKVYFSSLNVPNKGIPFPKIKQLIFDEYLIFEDRYHKFLPNETMKFLDILQTIARNKTDFRTFLIANEINLYNPYFAFWGIESFHKDREFTWVSKPDIVMQWVQDADEWIDDYNKSAFKRIVKGTEYDAYMLGERAIVDIEVEIKKHPDGSEYVLNLANGNTTLALWRMFNTYYATDKGIDRCKYTYVSRIEDTGKGRVYDPVLKRQIKDLISINKLFAENKPTRTKVMEWLR